MTPSNHHPQPPKNVKLPAKFYVTTSIPYASARPHLGHAMEFIQADCLARYYRDQGVPTRFQIGTDEHGQKLYDAAKSAGTEPLAFVNEISQSFISLAQQLGISHDSFVRTSDVDHMAGAQALWKACAQDIYKGHYSGLYCIDCELYYTEKDAFESCCPVHRHRRLEELTIDSYFLKLAPYQERLMKLIESDEYRVFPGLRKNEILSFLRNNQLEDLSISRPKSQLVWGVEVPGDPEHVMYVWFDALSNYITTLGYADGSDEMAKWWPANLHIVGKDINRFHSVYWPIMLMSAGVALPEALFVHGFINAPGGLKMSKSLGNYVDPVQVIERYGVDALRYYLLRYIPHDNDGEFGIDRFHDMYTADLVNDLGNLVQRVAVMLTKNNHSQYQSQPDPQFGGIEADWVFEADFDGVLAQIFSWVSALNKELEVKQPWQLIKTDPSAAIAILSAVASDLNYIASALQPFLPATATKITETFKDGKIDSSVGIIFPRVEPEDK